MSDMKLTRAQIRAVFLDSGFTIKPGEDDLMPYVYKAAEALLRAYTGAAAPQDERAAFEAFANADTSGVKFERDEDGDYIDMSAALLWHGWQARAALPAQAVAPADPRFNVSAQIMQAVCESERANPDHGGTICIASCDLRAILQTHLPDEAATAADEPVSALETLRSVWHVMQNSADGDVLLDDLESLRPAIAAAVEGQALAAPVRCEQTGSMGIPLSCGGALCAPDSHHPLCKMAAPVQDVAPLDDREAFEAAMWESGYERPKRGPFADSQYLHQRDQDRYTGWQMARMAPPAVAKDVAPSDARWYAVDRRGMATLCANADDALKTATEAAQDWPSLAPYVAVRMMPVGAQPAAQPADAPTPEDIAALARASDDFEGSSSTDESHATLMRLANLGLLECSDFHVTPAGRAAILARTQEGAAS